MRHSSSDRYILPEISSGLPAPEPVTVRAVILLNPEPVILDSSTMVSPAKLINSGQSDFTEVARIPEEVEVALHLPNIVCELE